MYSIMCSSTSPCSCLRKTLHCRLGVGRRGIRHPPPQHLKLILKGTGPIASVFGSVHYLEHIRLTRLPVCLVFAGFRFDWQAEMWCFLMLKILRAVFGCLFWQYDASLVWAEEPNQATFLHYWSVCLTGTIFICSLTAWLTARLRWTSDKVW